VTQVLSRQAIRFIEDEDRRRHLREDVEHERELVAGDRGIGAESDQGRIDVWHERALGHAQAIDAITAGCVD
jgi:hypothetical protein